MSDTLKLTPEERNERNRAAVRRGLKVALYTFVGYMLVIALGLAVYVLTQLAIDPALIAVFTPAIAGVIGGVHKALEWRASPLGLDLPEPPGESDTGEIPGGLQ